MGSFFKIVRRAGRFDANHVDMAPCSSTAGFAFLSRRGRLPYKNVVCGVAHMAEASLMCEPDKIVGYSAFVVPNRAVVADISSKNLNIPSGSYPLII